MTYAARSLKEENEQNERKNYKILHKNLYTLLKNGKGNYANQQCMDIKLEVLNELKVIKCKISYIEILNLRNDVKKIKRRSTPTLLSVNGKNQDG